MRAIFASFATMVVACSSNPYDPGAGSTAGGGTKTLSVEGSATAHPNVPNAAQASEFTTDFSVGIMLNNVPITTGTVTMTSASGKVELTSNMQNAGRWEGSGNGYDEVYQLDVVSGPDKVTGVRVDGPGIHKITAPTDGASVDSTMPNMLTWERDVAAQAADLRLNGDGGGGGGNGDLTVDDTGSFMIPANTFVASKDQSRPATVRLTRSNQIAPAGATAGSQLTVGVENEIDVVVLANPNAP